MSLHCDNVHKQRLAREVVEGMEEDLLAADAKVLNTTTDELRKLDVGKSPVKRGDAMMSTASPVADPASTTPPPNPMQQSLHPPHGLLRKKKSARLDELMAKKCRRE